MIRGTRFVKIYGYVLIIFFGGCLYTVYVTSQIQDRPIYSFYFGNIISLWYFITGVGLLARRIWGYYLFKVFLYLLFLAFPIGTIISYKSLQYMKRNDIKNLFHSSASRRTGRTKVEKSAKEE